MQTIRIEGVIVNGALIEKRIKTGNGVQVNDGHGPDITGFFYGLYIGVKIFTAGILILLSGLDVRISGIEIGSVDRGEQDYLFGREHFLDGAQCNVDAPAVGAFVHAGGASPAEYGGFWLMDGGYYRIFGLVVPVSYGDCCIEIIRPDEDEYGVKLVSVF